MKRSRYMLSGIGALVAGLAIAGVCITRGAALAEGATVGQKLLFSLSLIGVVIGVLIAITGVLPPKKVVDIRTLCQAALFAALCYIGFTYTKIDIPVGAEKTAFHLGNVFCVLAALFFGGFWGGMAGAVGMTVADLTTAYVSSAPKTFVLKLCIGLITGLIAHKCFHISRDDRQRKLPLSVSVVLSCGAGMAFNMVADPLLGYFYKMYILGVPQEAASIWAKIGAMTTSVNAVVAVIAASVFYLALRPALKKSGQLPKI